MFRLFEALSIFDWVTPAKGFVEDAINDPTLFQVNSWTFFIPYDASLEAGYNARMIERLMDRHSVKRWGSQITGGEFFFTVPKEQAQWAEYLMLQSGIPILPMSTGAPPPQPEKPMAALNNVTDFAPIGVVRIGPSLPGRLLRWLFG